MLDFFFLGGIVPDNTITLVKRGLRFIPLFGGLYTLSGNLFVHRNNPIKAALALERALPLG
jgi:1-acyl-sn-glycerol-3-phosphate acyltransferase